MIYQGDCRAVLKTLASENIKVQTCVTSPPYFGLRDYGTVDQLGLESSPDEYVKNMVEVFRGVHDVLADDGTLWLNLGDSYGTGTKAPRTQGARGLGATTQAAQDSVPRCGGMAKQLLGIPWRVALALQADGWYLRQDIIWHKPNPMPESVQDRCTKAHEYIFLLAKSQKYYFDSAAMQEPCIKGAAGSEFHTGKTAAHQLGRSSSKPRTTGNKSHKYVTSKGSDTPYETRNRRSVWTVATKPYAGAHFATFPPDLIEPCILAGAPPCAIVLDPFNGAGTTGLVAMKNRREYIGIELNQEYIALSEERFKNMQVNFL